MSGQSVYSYVGNNPVNYIDPLGLIYTAIRIWLSNEFWVIYSDENTLLPEDVGFFTIPEAPCTFICLFTDEEWDMMRNPDRNSCGT